MGSPIELHPFSLLCDIAEIYSLLNAAVLYKSFFLFSH